MTISYEELFSIFDILIEDAGMTAYIVFKNREISESLLYDDMKRFLNEHNIIFGLDNDMIAKVCDKPSDFIDKKTGIARGKPQTNGEDAYIKWELNEEVTNKPKELQDGSVDYFNLSKIKNFKKGQLIAKKIPGIDGEPGINVAGEEVPQKKGKDIQLKQGKNVVLNDTKDKIYAAIDGQFAITDKNKINVFPIYEVNGDLDLSIGNIDFVGSVVVRGNVPDGFKIKADGEIKVHGNVEGAELIAGGDITIKQGVIGHNKSLIKSGKSFKSSYILDGNVSASEDILVTQSIMHSYVSAGNQVACKGTKGIIVGGKVQAGKSVVATSVGNHLATSTIIEVGIPPELRDELQNMHKTKIDLVTSLDKVDKGIKMLDKLNVQDGKLPPDKKMLQVNLLNQQIIIEKELKSIKIKESDLEEKLSSYYDNTNIQVFKEIYPGVKLVIGRAIKIITVESKYMKFVLEEGEVIPKSLR